MAKKKNPPTTVFDMRGQQVGKQYNIAGDYHHHASGGSGTDGPPPKAGGDSTARCTVVHLDLVGYSDKARELEEHLGPDSVMQLNQQIQGFVDQGLAAIGQRREDVVNGTAGDSALLLLSTPILAHHFAEAVHQATASHNSTRTKSSAERWFRIGVATGEVVTYGAEVAGITIADAVRLEAAGHPGQILVDAATYEGLPAAIKSFYVGPETIKGKREEQLPAWRHAVIQDPATPTQPPASPPERRAPQPAPNTPVQQVELKEEDLRKLQDGVAKKIEAAIGDKAEWFAWMAGELDGEPTDAKGIAGQLAEADVTSSLGLLVTQVGDNLRELPETEHGDWLQRAGEVMNQLLLLVAHPGYVSSLRKRFDAGASELAFDAERRSLVAVLLACMFRRKAELRPHPDGPFGPRHVNALTEEGAPEFGTVNENASEDVRRYVWNCVCPARPYGPDCVDDLAYMLKGARGQRRPWYLTIPFDDDAPWGAIAEACPGLLLLRVREASGAGHIRGEQGVLRIHLSDLVALFGTKEAPHA